MLFIKENKYKIINLLIGVLAIPYIYIIINTIFTLGKIIGNIVRIKIG